MGPPIENPGVEANLGEQLSHGSVPIWTANVWTKKHERSHEDLTDGLARIKTCVGVLENELDGLANRARPLMDGSRKLRLLESN
jgi:hypothetical protein